jgi:hypothetical protein
MTRKHFEAIAKAFSSTLSEKPDFTVEEHETLEALAGKLSDVFASDNPRFDKERFLKACLSAAE